MGRGARVLSRRQVLCLTAVAACGAALPSALWARELKRIRWRGPVLGTLGAITLYHDDEASARALLAACAEDIARLERWVSLDRADSLINQLNREGRLAAPPAELVALLRDAHAVSELTDGAFDITVQPLWRLYAAHFEAPGASPAGPSRQAIERARRSVAFRALEIAPERLRFARPGMAITLNGIAQGWLTDLVTERLSTAGYTSALVDLGELRALGAPVGRTDRRWHVRLRQANQDVALTDGAIACSSPSGTVFEATGRFHHLFDPRSGDCAGETVWVDVRATSAQLADALSTGLSAMSHAESRRLLAHGGLAQRGVQQVRIMGRGGELIQWPPHADPRANAPTSV